MLAIAAKAEHLYAPPTPVHPGSKVMAGPQSLLCTLTGLVCVGSRIFGATVAHGVANAPSAILDARSRAQIGDFDPTLALNSDVERSSSLETYIRYFSIHAEVTASELLGDGSKLSGVVDSLGFSGPLFRIGAGGERLSARLVARRAAAYVDGLHGRPGFAIAEDGLLIRPDGSPDDFVSAGDSGTVVFDGQGRGIGLVVARDEDSVLLAPLFPSFLKHGLRFATAADLADRAISGTRVYVRSSPFLLTSESAAEGNPDKVCDRISDEIVDLLIQEAVRQGIDPSSVRASCDVLATTNRVVISGEVRAPASLLKKDRSGAILHDASGQPIVNPVKFKSVARKAVRSIGYEQAGFHWKAMKVDVLLHGALTEVAFGANSSADGPTPASDQAVVFGYATRESPELLPAPIYLAHRMLELLTIARRGGQGALASLGPDAKSQVSVRYERGRPVGVSQIVLSIQQLDYHLSSADIRQIVEPYILQAMPDGWVDDRTVWHINSTGKYVIGGPDGDAGLTGRKVDVDSYGGAVSTGSAFSGKSPSNIKRSGAYAARYLAKNLVAADLADRATVQLSYAMGIARPISILVDLHDTGKVDEPAVEAALEQLMDLSVSGICKHLGLYRPIYAKTAAFGHFGRAPGRDGSFSWERTDLTKALKAALL